MVRQRDATLQRTLWLASRGVYSPRSPSLFLPNLIQQAADRTADFTRSSSRRVHILVSVVRCWGTGLLDSKAYLNRLLGSVPPLLTGPMTTSEFGAPSDGRTAP